MSPILFNVYLDDALRQNKVLDQFIKKDRLLAFADDIVVHTCDEEQVQRVVKAFDEIR